MTAVTITWKKIGQRIECSAETARARWRRGEFTVRKPKRWNNVLVINEEFDREILEFAERAPIQMPHAKAPAAKK